MDNNMKEMPNPTPVDLVDPLFNAIWDVTKTWDVNAPEYYEGYCGLNGSHVMLILNSIRQQLAEQPKVDALVEALNGLLEHESNFASNKGDCNCNFKSRELSIKYENMRCPHQLARKALATYQSKNEKE